LYEEHAPPVAEIVISPFTDVILESVPLTFIP